MAANPSSCGSRTCGNLAVLGRLFPLMFVLILTAAGLTMGRKETAGREEKTAAPDTASAAIRGRVEIWEGNFMPMIEPGRTGGTILPGSGRRVRLHEPVRMSAGGLVQARRDSIGTPLIAEAVCDSAGMFSLAVAPGTYSIFVEEQGGWYYNGWDGNGVQGAVTVMADSTTEVTIKITTKATF